ncbi:MAG TPA: AMIN domain-containing protein [Syntrophobacteria bacterium]|nr:AMIN domain-containing protein [Syntrophobacteria bacterium]
MGKGWTLLACLLAVARLSMGCATPPVAPQANGATVEEQAVLPPDVLTDLQVVGRDLRLIFKLSDSTWRTYTAVDVTGPSRVIIDLPNTLADGIPPSWPVENGLIKKIETVTVYPKPQPYTRVVIELARETAYTIGRVEEEILVVFADTPESPVISSALVRARAEPATVEPSSEIPSPQSPPAGEEELLPAGRLLTLQAAAIPREANFLIVADGRLDRYRVFNLTDPPRVVVDLLGVESSDVKDVLTFSGSLVRMVRVNLHGDGVRLVFDLIPEVGVTYQVISEADTLQVLFRAASGVSALPGS